MYSPCIESSVEFSNIWRSMLIDIYLGFTLKTADMARKCSRIFPRDSLQVCA